MKRLRMFVATLVILSNISGVAFAEGETTLTGTAGITPDSIFYGLDKALDSTKIALTFNEEKRVEVIVDIAEERLGESEVMIEAGKEDLAKTAIEAYSENMATANEILQQIIQTTEGEEVIPEAETTVEEAVENVETEEGTVPENTTTEENTIVEETTGNTTETAPTEEVTPVEETATQENVTEENTDVDETTKENTTEEEQTTEGDTPAEEVAEDEVTEEDVQVDEEKNEKLAALEAKIIERHQKSIEILKAIQEKVSDETKITIEAAIEMQTVRQNAIVQMVGQRHEFNTVKEEIENSIAKLEEAKTGGDEAAIKAAEEAVSASKEKFFESKSEFKEAFINSIVVNKAVKVVKKELQKELKDEVKAGNITKEEAKAAVKSLKTNNGQGIVNRIKNKVEDIKVEVRELEDRDDDKDEVKREELKKKEEKAREEQKNREEKARKELKEAEKKAKGKAKEVKEKVKENQKTAKEKAKEAREKGKEKNSR